MKPPRPPRRSSDKPEKTDELTQVMVGLMREVAALAVTLNAIARLVQRDMADEPREPRTTKRKPR